MVTARSVAALPAKSKFHAILSVVAVGLLTSACAGAGSPLELANASDEPAQMATGAGDTGPQSDLEKATQYWGKQFEKNPREPKNAVNYARNLKAMGQKEQALGVLQAAHGFSSNDRALNSEYGRAALEMDQISTAQKLLEQADDPSAPDWRTISARGTVLAKQGNYREAIPHYERALAAAPGQATVLNNLALAHAMDGHPDRAEGILRQAADANSRDPRISQNLSLVLGLQGKYDEAKLVGAKTLPAENADSNVAYVRHMVKAEPKAIGAPAEPAVAAAPLAVAKVATGSTKKAKADVPPRKDTRSTVEALADAHYAAEQARLAKSPQPAAPSQSKAP